MDTREIASEYRLTHWAGLLRERRESGESIRSFCEKKGFHENIFYYWQKKLREATIGELRKTNESAMPPSREAPGFIEVKVPGGVELQSYTERNCGNTIRVEAGGLRITAESGYPVEQLAVLLARIVRSC
jgi:hypothetical protein